MTPQSQLFLLALGVVGILIVLGLIGTAMRARLPAGTVSPALETYMTRVHAWWLIVFLIALALIIGRTGVVVLCAIAAFAALREYVTLSFKTRGDHLALAAAFYLILPAQFVLVWLDWARMFTVFIPVYVFLALPVLSLLRGGPARLQTRVAETQWGLMICVYGASHIPALMLLDVPGYDGRAVLLIAFLFLTVQGGELLDYFFGRRVGRHRILPDLSSRTWEGAVAGVISAMAIGVLLSGITPYGPLAAALMAGAGAVAGMAGGLILIALKHDKGVTDWSHVIPGQGGFLDQLGGVMFAAPVIYHLTLVAYVP